MAQSNTPAWQRSWEAYAVLVPLIFIPAVWLLIGRAELSEERAHNAFLAQLNGLSTAFVLNLNGTKVDDPSRIVADLRRLKLYRGEHAPGREPKLYRIEIRDDQRILRLLLARPENVGDKYWVFSPPRTDSESLGMRLGGFIDPQLAELLAERER